MPKHQAAIVNPQSARPSSSAGSREPKQLRRSEMRASPARGRGNADMGVAASRRGLLRFGLAGGALVLGGTAPIGRPEAQTTTRVRKDVHTLAPDDPILATYRDAVRHMRGRPSTDRRSWAYQTNIH